MTLVGQELTSGSDRFREMEFMMATGALRQLIERFCSGADVSVKAANAMEVAIDEAFPEDEQAQDVALFLASYRPGGGDFLYDEHVVGRQLALLLPRLAEDH